MKSRPTAFCQVDLIIGDGGINTDPPIREDSAAGVFAGTFVPWESSRPSETASSVDAFYPMMPREMKRPSIPAMTMAKVKANSQPQSYCSLARPSGECQRVGPAVQEILTNSMSGSGELCRLILPGRQFAPAADGLFCRIQGGILSHSRPICRTRCGKRGPRLSG
jgi:hypothetical protein